MNMCPPIIVLATALLSLGHLKTFSGHELPLHFSITPRSAITRRNNLGGGGGGGCMFIKMCSARQIRFLLKSIVLWYVNMNI
jgi:hypothetical protein